MDESERKTLAQDVADIVKLSKISDIWKDPKKAQNWGITGWLVAYVAVLVAFAAIAIPFTTDGVETDSQNRLEVFKDIAVSNMNCAALKQTLLDLDAKDDKQTDLSWSLERQIIARC